MFPTNMENKNTFVVHLHCFLPSAYWYTASYSNYEKNVIHLPVSHRDPGEEQGVAPNLSFRSKHLRYNAKALKLKS